MAKTERQNPHADDADHCRDEWSISDDVTYLNHGSFGPSPKVVQRARQEWTDRLEREPMDFFVRQMEESLDRTCRCVGKFVGADAEDLILVDNATTGMNIVAANVELQPDNEVLATDHEYGAVLRIWRRACKRARAKVVVRKLPDQLVCDDEIVDAFMAGVTENTRLIVVSHVTSPTAVILPVEKICRRARERRIPVCIDGPHAVAMLPLDLNSIACDFYTASCHKWLSAPFGTGFLYVRRGLQQNLRPCVTSWGGSFSDRPATWKDEFIWTGTHDPAGYLSIPTAIEFLESYGFSDFRIRTHSLAQYARQQITKLTGLEPHVDDSPDWYGSMISLPLPPSKSASPRQGQPDPLQNALWQRAKIEVPVISWQRHRFVRVSCHLYNRRADIDLLVDALRELIGQRIKASGR